MIFTLIGMVVLGAGIVGLTLLLFRLSGRRTPRGLLPVVAGVGMFGFVIWNDYSWFSRTSGVLPEHIQVVRSYTERSLLQPWSYLIPPTHRFMAVDLQSRQRHPALPNMVMAQLHLVARYRPTFSPWQMFDCQRGQRAPVENPSDLNPESVHTALDWLSMEPDDPLLRTACQS